MAKALMDQIEAVCDGKWMSKAKIQKALPDALSSSISGLLTHLIRRERLVRRGEPRSYEYQRNTGEPSEQSVPQAEPRPSDSTATAANSNFAASLGVACDPTRRGIPPGDLPRDDDGEAPSETSAPATSAAAAETEAVVALFDADVAYTLAELVDSSGLNRETVLPLLQEAVLAGAIRSRVTDGVVEYFLVDDEELAAALATPTEAEVAAEARLPRELATPRAVPARLISTDLRHRLAAIALDIEDAIGDACDTRAPYEVIKALVVANSGAHRALRGLGN